MKEYEFHNERVNLTMRKLNIEYFSQNSTKPKKNKSKNMKTESSAVTYFGKIM